MDDADVLRIILVVVGAFGLVAVYLWGRQTRRRRETRRQRHRPGSDVPQFDTDMKLDAVQTADELAEELADLERVLSKEADAVPVAPERPALVSESRPAMAEEARLRSQSKPTIRQPKPPRRQPASPLVVQLSVVASREKEFGGDDIHRVLSNLGLHYGDMKIFHRRLDDADTGKVVFSVASMVEPGTIPEAGEGEFSTPGLTFFLQLSGSEDGLDKFDNMLFSAQRVAQELGGELQDARHSTLTRQTVGHLREEIIEHCRRAQLERMRQ